MQEIVKAADINTCQNFYKKEFALEYEVEKLFDLTIKSYEFEKEKIKPEDRYKYPPWVKDFIVKKTDVNRDYQLPYFAKAVATRSIKLPEGYVVLPHHQNIIKNLKKHGILISKIRRRHRHVRYSFLDITDRTGPARGGEDTGSGRSTRRRAGATGTYSTEGALGCQNNTGASDSSFKGCPGSRAATANYEDIRFNSLHIRYSPLVKYITG